MDLLKAAVKDTTKLIVNDKLKEMLLIKENKELYNKILIILN